MVEWQAMRYHRISLLLLSLSVILWTISVRFSHLDIGDYGLVNSLRPEYFISLFLLTVSFLVLVKFEPRARFLLGLHLVVFALFMILPSIVLESAPRGDFTYLCATCVKSIEHSNHIYPAEVFYLKWPGLHILGAEVTTITGMGTRTLMFWFPLLLQMMLLPVAAFLFRRLCNTPREFWIAMWLVILFPPLFGNLFLPTNTATLLLILSMGIVLWSPSRFNRPVYRTSAMLVLLLAALTIMHALTSLVTLIDLVIVFSMPVIALAWKRVVAAEDVVHRVGAMASGTWQAARRGLGTPSRLLGYVGYDRLALLILCMAFIAAWQFFGIESLHAPVTPSGESIAPPVQPGNPLSPVSPESGLESIVELSFGGSEAHTQVVILRILYGGILSVLALGVFLRLVIARKMDANSIMLMALIVVTSAILMTLSQYGGEMLARAFWYATPWLCILAARCIVSGKLLTGILVIVLLVSPVLTQVFRYGNEALDYVPPPVITSAEFASHETPESKTTLETAWATGLWLYELYGSDSNIKTQSSPLNGAQYVAMSQSLQQALHFFKDLDLDGYEQGLSSYNRIYANGEAELFSKE
ncbi:hypothetical protein ACFLXE_06840 [Chloroflexota bacterium]